MEVVNKANKGTLEDIQLAPTPPCLICGRCLQVKTEISEEIGGVTDENHQFGEDDKDNSGSAPSVLQYFVKLFKVSPEVWEGDGDDEDERGRVQQLRFCHLCKHRLKLLMEVQRKLEELTEQLRSGREELQKAVESSEEVIKEHEMRDIRYRTIRRQILGEYKREEFLPEEDLDLRSSSVSESLTVKGVTDSRITRARTSSRRAPFVQLTRTDKILAVEKRESSFGEEEETCKKEEILDTFSEPDHDLFERDDISNEKSTYLSSCEDEMESKPQPRNKIRVKRLRNATESNTKTLVTTKKRGRPAKTNSNTTQGPSPKRKFKVNANADDTELNGDSRSRKRSKGGTHHLNIIPLESEESEDDSVDDKAGHGNIAKKCQKKKFKCKLCGKVLKSALAVRLHVESIHEKRIFPCEICGKPLKSRSSVIHKLSHLGEQEKQELRESGDHSVDNILQKRLQCEECGIYVARCTLPVHRARMHGTEEEKARYRYREFCSECGKYVNSMKQHLEHVHNTVRMFPCLQCEKRFKTHANLKAHIKFVHERDNYRFKCTMCPKTFCRKTQLDDHINVHLNIRQFQCQFCPVAFTQGKHLKRHIRRFHEEGSNPKRKTGVRKPCNIGEGKTTQSVQM